MDTVKQLSELDLALALLADVKKDEANLLETVRFHVSKGRAVTIGGSIVAPVLCVGGQSSRSIGMLLFNHMRRNGTLIETGRYEGSMMTYEFRLAEVEKS